MREKILYWSSLGLGGLALIIFITNVVMVNNNRALQQTFQERQGFINNMQNLSNLNRELAQTLSDIAVRDKDTALKDLLASQGIMVTEPQASASPATQAKSPKN